MNKCKCKCKGLLVTSGQYEIDIDVLNSSIVVQVPVGPHVKLAPLSREARDQRRPLPLRRARELIELLNEAIDKIEGER